MNIACPSKLLRAAIVAMAAAACIGAGAVSDRPAAEKTAPKKEASATEEKLATQLRLLAALYAEDNQQEKAVECYETILALNPEDPQGLEELAGVCFRYRFYDKAKPALEKLNGLEPGDPMLLHQLAICYRAAGEDEKHREYFEKALESNPESKEAHLNTAIYFEQYGLMDVVYAEFKKTLGIKPKNKKDETARDALALNKMAFYLSDEGKYREAAEAYGNFLILKEQYDAGMTDETARAASHKCYCEGRDFEKSGKLQKAQAKYEKSVREWEDNIDARGALYLCLKAQNRNEEAKRVFKAAVLYLAAATENAGGEPSPDALNALAWFHAVTGEETEDGLKLARRAVEAAPREPAFADTLAELYYKTGDYENAVKYSEIALNLPKDWNVPYYRRQHAKMKKALNESRSEPVEDNP